MGGNARERRVTDRPTRFVRRLGYDFARLLGHLGQSFPVRSLTPRLIHFHGQRVEAAAFSGKGQLQIWSASASATILVPGLIVPGHSSWGDNP